ncbi:4-carboxy-2-hydroxymuconate-6-semialdehyde dehydrogenase [Posidoniimonas polymericola]|uniref:4-carboxy-2-hydroxymuconate-6-semialdehyde dehydrogenase n=1 Tax=Posidoniimonas polymericola TaxID=2528002 RepID=A0A5C5ZHG2_9BACT|nr:Gfo/Idh/MocA family oxidoreductase [Posidoniimonas polymericola]TWT85993.1 4-carboxy-2-hydroxymuconate-6-semialdehyde dehydrogenase [Posidoniimonas polymericola]
MNPSTRRHFLKLGTASTAGLALGRSARASSANEAVRIGLVGCGVRGRSFLQHVVAVCDPDQSRLAKAAASAGVGERDAVTDLRRLLDRSDIDAVVIATPDHWHAPAAILACRAGKHVYVEKPVSHNFRESQLLIQAADQAGVTVQHGTQQRSRRFTQDAIAMLHDGAIGDILVAKAWNIQQRGSIGNHSPSRPPEGVDYDTWVGPAEWLPFQENRFHSDWHWWRNFGTGDIGNDGAHEIDYARWGLGVDALPNRVTALGGKYFYDDDQQYPDTATCGFEFDLPGGKTRQLMFEMRLWTRNYPMNCDSGVEFYGTEGQMFLSKRGKLRVVGPNNEKLLEKRPGDEDREAHVNNFVDAIRGDAELNAPLTEAHRSIGLIHLANIALQTGGSLAFEPQAEQILDNPQASRLLRRSYRRDGHWSVPEDAERSDA